MSATVIACFAGGLSIGGEAMLFPLAQVASREGRPREDRVHHG